MTESEAVKKLTDFHQGFEMLGLEDGVIGVSLKALEKQVPKKPRYIDTDCNYFECPVCGEAIFSSDKLETHKYCLECGQAIDWSDPVVDKLRDILDQEEKRFRNL